MRIQGQPAAAIAADIELPPIYCSTALERARSLILVLVLAASLTCVVLGAIARIRVDVGSAVMVAEVVAAALLASLCWRPGRLARLSDCFGVLGFCWLAGVVAGLMSLIALRLQVPLRDSFLFQIDRLLGLNGVAYVAWVAAQPRGLLTALTTAYSLTLPVIFISLAVTSLTGNRIEAWRAALCFVGALLTVCAIAIMMPAKGIGSSLPEHLFQSLPNGAARYFWHSFDEFRGGADPLLRVDAIDGVVSFPSFHMVMGLIVIAMWRKRPLSLFIILLWAIPMFAATVPLGGHYFIDLIGGILVWSLWWGIAVNLIKPRDTSSKA